MNDFALHLLGWQLFTAEVFYRMPDHLDLLQFFLWQDIDRAPDFPRLNKFLHYWQDNLDGPIHSVRVAVRGIIVPTDLTFVDSEFRLM